MITTKMDLKMIGNFLSKLGKKRVFSIGKWAHKWPRGTLKSLIGQGHDTAVFEAM